jgi:hypothetical protein
MKQAVGDGTEEQTAQAVSLLGGNDDEGGFSLVRYLSQRVGRVRSGTFDQLHARIIGMGETPGLAFLTSIPSG